jgi:mannosyltransferase
VLAVAIVAAAVARLATLTRDDLWIDEAYTLAMGQRGAGGMVRLFAREANGTLYQVADLPLVAVSESLVALRMPAAVAGILAVPAVFWAGRRLVGDRASLAAALLVAVSPMAVTHSQDARPIIFVVTFSAVSYGCLVRAGRDGGAGMWALYVLATAAVFYSNLASGAMLVLAQAVHALAVEPRARRPWAASLAALAVLLVPLAVLTALERTKRDPLYWLTAPSAQDLVLSLRTIAGGAPALVLIAAALAAVAWSARRDPGRWRRFLHSPWATLTAWAAVPLLGLWTVSQAVPVFQPRYAIASLPAVCLLAGAAADRLPRPLGIALVAALLALGVRGVVVDGGGDDTAEWAAATRALDAARAPGDPLIVDPFTGLVAAGFYDRDLAAPGGDLVVSEWHDRPIPDGVVLLDDPGGYGDVPAGPPSAALVADLARRTGTVHLLLSATSGQGDVWDSEGVRWGRRSCDVSRARFRGVDVISMRDCAPG